MIVYVDLARGALDILGKMGAAEIDDYRDAQSGKILHEFRVGELAGRKLIPTPYLGDDQLFRKHEGVAEKVFGVDRGLR